LCHNFADVNQHPKQDLRVAKRILTVCLMQLHLLIESE
jgi:hypothetical protein